MERFAKFHPFISFSYFMAVIAFTVLLNNPIYIFMSLIGAFIYRLKLSVSQALSVLKFVFPLVLFAGLFNMLFSHYGVTVLFSIGSYEFMLESLFFGLFTGIMLGAVIFWFSCYTEVVTSEKFMALFGNFAPNLVLLFSMVLRFIPLMIKTAEEIKEANAGLGNDVRGIKNSINRFSSLVSISLEKSMETADSMRSRGFGNKKRKPYNRYKFLLCDAFMLAVTVLFCVLFAVFYIMKINCFLFEPELKLLNNNAAVYILFGIFSLIPVIVDLAEELKWHFLRLKI